MEYLKYAPVKDLQEMIFVKFGSNVLRTLTTAVFAAAVSLGASGALPDGYVRLESVSSTKGGGQYIKTGVYPEKGKTTSVEIKYQYLTLAVENWLFGYWEGFGSPAYGTAIGMGNSGNVATDRLRVGETGGYYGQSDKEVHELLFNTADVPKSGFVIKGY